MKESLKKNYYKTIGIFALFLVLPSALKACAVCFSGTEETLWAFYITTLILIILPIAMIVSVVLWLYKKKLASVNQPV